MIQEEFGNVYASGVAMIFIISPILTYFYGKDGIALGSVAVEVWQKPLEIRFVIYQIQPRNLGKLNAG
jgi:hypothetical protein